MRRHRLAGFGALCAVLFVAAATGVAPAASPAVTGSQAVVAGSPTAIACGGSVDARVTLTGQSGTTGAATDVMLVLDLSGSTGVPATKLADLKRAATDALDALDAADGLADHAIANNRAGVVVYQNTSAAVTAPLGSSYDTLKSAVDGAGPPRAGARTAPASRPRAARSASSTNAKAMVLMTDGLGTSGELTAAGNAATTAKANSIRIVGIGIGGDASQANLTSWASPASYYQVGHAGPINKTKLARRSRRSGLDARELHASPRRSARTSRRRR